MTTEDRPMTPRQKRRGEQISGFPLPDEPKAATVPPIDRERLAQALYSGHVQHVLHSYSYTNREIANEIAAAYEDGPTHD